MNAFRIESRMRVHRPLMQLQSAPRRSTFLVRLLHPLPPCFISLVAARPRAVMYAGPVFSHFEFDTPINVRKTDCGENAR